MKFAGFLAAFDSNIKQSSGLCVPILLQLGHSFRSPLVLLRPPALFPPLVLPPVVAAVVAATCTFVIFFHLCHELCAKIIQCACH